MSTTTRDEITSNAASTQNFVICIGADDVILGRGLGAMSNTGNLTFRQIILDNKDEYVSTRRHSVKDDIARRILHTIHHRGGHFLQRIESSKKTMKELGLTEDTEAWWVVNDEVSLRKIKQALRDNVTSERNPETDASTTKSSIQTHSSDHIPSKRKSQGISYQVGKKIPGQKASSQSDFVPSNDAPTYQEIKESETTASHDDEGALSTPQSREDLEFRLMHPTLRKRDLVQLRRQLRNQVGGIPNNESNKNVLKDVRVDRTSGTTSAVACIRSQRSNSDDNKLPRHLVSTGILKRSNEPSPDVGSTTSAEISSIVTRRSIDSQLLIPSDPLIDDTKVKYSEKLRKNSNELAGQKKS